MHDETACSAAENRMAFVMVQRIISHGGEGFVVAVLRRLWSIHGSHEPRIALPFLACGLE